MNEIEVICREEIMLQGRTNFQLSYNHNGRDIQFTMVNCHIMEKVEDLKYYNGSIIIQSREEYEEHRPTVRLRVENGRYYLLDLPENSIQDLQRVEICN